MHTTNTATPGIPATYVQRRQECEKLTELAQKLELIANRSGSFLDDPEFQALSAAYQIQLREVHSLSTF
jgi:hypothetical protein